LTLGLPAVNRPGLSLLFFGPSGVGKTRFAETLAEALAPQKESRLRIDLSQYKDPMSMTKLVGAPAGYVGYRDQGALTDHVKHHPEAVVLFDDLDRAHPEILHALGKLLTTGFLSDATGLSIDFRKTRLLFTTSATKKATEKTLGFGGDENEEARGHLEELLGARIIESMHGAIPLNRLNESDHLVIAKRELQKLLSFAKTRGLTLSHDSAILAHLAQSATKNAGVRGIKKRIEEEIETLIAEELLSESQKKKRALKLTVKNGKAVLARAK
jgi:ATP-dependent Clp protease ATP-binding subunit ClpE